MTPRRDTITVDTASVTPAPLDAGPVAGALDGPFGADYFSLDIAEGDTVTVTLSDGSMDPCPSADDLRAYMIVRDPVGRLADAAYDRASVSWGPVAAAGVYVVEAGPAPGCATCPFDYTIAVKKS